MKPLTERDIRSSMVNATKGEAQRIPLPGLHEMLWDQREYLGWRDPKAPQRGYIVRWEDDEPVGIVLRAADIPPRTGMTAMCSLCRTPQPASQVALFTAPKAGPAGRDGNTVGTYICADLACSHIIRVVPPASPLLPDPAATVQQRIMGLVDRLGGFLDRVRSAPGL